MKVVFLAGGIAKRMFPLTQDKFMLEFAGRTLFEHHLDMAKGAGLKDFVIIGNPSNIGKIRGIAEKNNLDAEFAVQQEPRGMADALLSARDMLMGEQVIVVNTNDVFDASVYGQLLKSYRENSPDACILGYRVDKYFPGGYLVVDDENCMKGIVEKPEPGTEPSNLVNIVVHLHADTKKLFSYLERTKSGKDDVYERSMDAMIKDGSKFRVVDYNDSWTAIKYPWHIFDVVKHYLDRENMRISGNAAISPKATIEGNVIIEDGVKILENATIRGPCYIGKNSIIGNNCLIWNYSHIGSNCVVGFSSEIKHSYVGNNCWFHTSYVGDSILGNGCSFGAGTITGNYRLDEKTIKVNIFSKGMMDSGLDKLGAIAGDGCKTGSNATLMPGVKMGPNSIVGPGVILREDLEPNKMVFVKQEHIIKENSFVASDENKNEMMNRLLKYGK